MKDPVAIVCSFLDKAAEHAPDAEGLHTHLAAVGRISADELRPPVLLPVRIHACTYQRCNSIVIWYSILVSSSSSTVHG